MAAGSIALASAYPVYFRTDDVEYLSWAATHDDPLDAFRPSEGELFGVVRPVHTIAWWSLYRVFGLEARGYQVFLSLAYGLSFLFFFLFVRRAVSFAAAALTLLSYAALFTAFMHIVFWFSDLTFALELLFTGLSLYLLALGVEGRRGLVACSVVAYVLAGLSKEPAIVVVPAVAALYVWVTTRRKALRRGALAFVVVGVAWALASPYLWGRQGLPLDQGAGAVFDYLAAGWRYYAGVLMTGSSAAVLPAAVFAATRLSMPCRTARTREPRKGPLSDVARPAFILLLPAALAAVSLAVARSGPTAGLAILSVALLFIVVRGGRAAPLAMWGLLPLVAVMTAVPRFAAYLTEASVGLAAVSGVAASRFLRDLGRLVRSLPRAAGLTVVVAIAVVAVGACVRAAPALRSAESAARAVSRARGDFAAAIGYIASREGDGPGVLLVVDYTDLGIERGDIEAMAPSLRATRQKTMARHEVASFLLVMGAGDLKVRNLEWYMSSADREPALALAMNRLEREHLETLPLSLELVFAASDRSESAWVYRVCHAGDALTCADL